MLRRRQARRRGPDLGLDKAGSPVMCGCGGKRPSRKSREPMGGAKNCGRLKEKVKEGIEERSEVQVEKVYI